MVRYAGIINNDVVNAQGVCVSFWCQGCPNKCEGCHNPETWDFNGGIETNEGTLIGKVISLISKNDIQRNLSILGGEPLCDENKKFVFKLIRAVLAVYPSVKIFMWTGYTYEELLARNDWIIYNILSNIDYLIDGRFEVDKRDVTLPLRGSKNQRVIDVQQSLSKVYTVLWEEEQS